MASPWPCMARPLRIEVAGGIHHVTARGNAKQPIYLDDLDNRRFMANGVYSAVLVQRDQHLLETARYIALNPVRAGLCKSAADWAWSSHRAVLGLETAGLVAVDELLSHFGGQTQTSSGRLLRLRERSVRRRLGGTGGAHLRGPDVSRRPPATRSTITGGTKRPVARRAAVAHGTVRPVGSGRGDRCGVPGFRLPDGRDRAGARLSLLHSQPEAEGVGDAGRNVAMQDLTPF